MAPLRTAPPLESPAVEAGSPLSRELVVPPEAVEPPEGPRLSARLEPFDSYCQCAQNPERGYTRFSAYYRANYLPRIPQDRSTRIAVLSCGPGYLVKTLLDAGYTDVRGIDACPEFVKLARDHDLPCEVGRPHAFLRENAGQLDLILPEQELNHLTLEETIAFLGLCRASLAPGGGVLVYAINGANPLTSAEHLSHNIDHFYAVTEYSLRQLLELGGFRNIEPFRCELYVFWKNPANWVGWGLTHAFELTVRGLMLLYGKKVRILSKRIGATARVGSADVSSST